MAALEEFKSFGVWPSIIHCALIHHYYCRMRDTERAEKWMSVIKTKHGIKPNLVFYGALIFAYYGCEILRLSLRLLTKSMPMGCPWTLNPPITSSILTLNPECTGKEWTFSENSYTPDKPKNLYSYAILANHLMHRADYASFYECISDAASGSNEITFHAFEPVLHQADRENLPHEIDKAIKRMVYLTIRFHPTIMHHVRRTFQQNLQCPNEIVYDMDGVVMNGIQFARCLLEKSMIEVNDQNVELLKMLDMLMEHYKITSNEAESQSLRQFVQERLPVLRRLWTELREEYLESIKLIEQTSREGLTDILWDEDDGNASLLDSQEGVELLSSESSSNGFTINK